MNKDEITLILIFFFTQLITVIVLVFIFSKIFINYNFIDNIKSVAKEIILFYSVSTAAAMIILLNRYIKNKKRKQNE